MESRTAKNVVRNMPGLKIAANEPLWVLRSRTAIASGASCTRRRIQMTSSAGSAPVQNMIRQARSSPTNEKTSVYMIAASAQPTAQELWIAPRVRPRCLALAYSATRIAPTAHSPPNPRPCRARKTSRVS